MCYIVMWTVIIVSEVSVVFRYFVVCFGCSHCVSTAIRYDTIRHDGVYVRLKAEMLRRNGPVVKSVESVLRLEGSLWWERFVKEVGLEARVKEKSNNNID